MAKAKKTKVVTYRLSISVNVHVPAGRGAVSAQEVLENMDYDFTSNTPDGEIVDTEILGWENVKEVVE